jgi:hypothetical protein
MIIYKRATRMSGSFLANTVILDLTAGIGRKKIDLLFY